MARGKKKETLTSEERLKAALVPESEQPYKVPWNWCWCFLGNIAFIRRGLHRDQLRHMLPKMKLV